MNFADPVSPIVIQELFQISPQTLGDWVRMGMPKQDRGLYNVADCVRWRLSYLDKKIRTIRYTSDETITDLKKEMQKIQNRERLVKLAKLEGQLIPFSKAQLAWAEQLSIIVRLIEALPAQINDLIGGDNQTFEIIRKAVNNARRDIAAAEINFDADIYTADEDQDEPGADSEFEEAV